MVQHALESCVADAGTQVKGFVQHEFTKLFATLDNLRCGTVQLSPAMASFVRKCETFIKKEARDLHQLALKAEEVRGDYVEQAYRLSMENSELDREPGDLDLQAFLERLTTNLEELKAEQTRRLEVFALRRAEERELCELLCAEVEPHAELSAGKIPCLSVLDKLETHVRKLKEEKHSREQRLNALRSETVELMDHLGQPPSNFVAAVGNADDLRLTLDYIDTVEMLRNDLRNLFGARLDQRKEYEENITSWSVRLGMAEDFKIDFPPNSVTDEVLASLTETNDRLNVLKLQHLSRLVNAAREDIKSLWESSLTSAEEKAAFRARMDQEEYTEELLIEHDRELKRLMDEAEGKKEILGLLEKRSGLLDVLRDCHDYDNDVNRYRNRGAELLEMQKKKKDTCKKLASAEGKIKAAISVWEERTGKPFLIAGATFGETIKRDADERVQWRSGHRGCVCLEHSKDENAAPNLSAPTTDRKATFSACIDRLARPKATTASKRRADAAEPDRPTPLKMRKTMATHVNATATRR